MRTSTLTLIALLAGAAACRLSAQPASPEVQGQAVELLRQTISKERQQPRQVPSSTPAPAPQPQPARDWTPPVNAASADQQQQAIQVLRQNIAEQKTSAPSVRVIRPAKPAQKTPSQKSGATPPGHVTSPAYNPAPVPAPSVSPQPSGPKTKQQRLSDLLEEYKADKLTPSEYQKERARILAEP